MITLLAVILACYGLYLVLSGAALVGWAVLQFIIEGFGLDDR